MADLAQLGIRVNFSDPQNAEKKLHSLQTQAERTEAATNKLSKTAKKKGTDALRSQAKATDKLRNNSGALMARLEGLNNKFNKIGQTSKGIQDLRGELNQVNKTIRKSDKLPLNTYNRLAQKSSEISTNLRKQNKALTDNANTQKATDKTHRTAVDTLDRQLNSINRLQETKGFWKSNASQVKSYRTQLTAAQRNLNNLQGTLSKQQFKKYSSQLAQAGHNLDYVGKRANFAHSRLREFWERFGQVGLGFGAIYGAIRAVGAAFMELFSVLKNGITLSGEIASLQAKLAAYHTITEGLGESTESFASKMGKAEGNIMALARASLNSASSFDDLQTAMDEFAQHSIFVGKEWMGSFTAFTDFVSLIAQTTGNTARQIRSEISGLMEGLARPQNVVIRMLMRTGMLTEEVLDKIRAAENAGDDIKDLIQSLGPLLGKLQEQMLKADIGTLFNKWKDAMAQSIAESISLASSMEGVTNIFGEMLNKHREWAVALIEDKDNMRDFTDGMKFIRSVLDLVMTGFERLFIATMKLFAFLERNKRIIGILATSFIAYHTVVKDLIGTLAKLGGVMKFLLSPIGKAIMALRTLHETLYLNASYIKDHFIKSIKSLANSFRTLSGAVGKMNLKLLTIPALLYSISVIFRVLYQRISKTKAWEAMGNAAESVLSAIGDAFQWVMNNAITPFLETLQETYNFWAGMVNLPTWDVDLSGLGGKVKNVISGLFEGTKDLGEELELGSLVSDITDIVKKDAGRLGKALAPIKEAFSDLFDYLRDRSKDVVEYSPLGGMITPMKTDLMTFKQLSEEIAGIKLEKTFDEAWGKQRTKELKDVIDKTQGLEESLKGLSEVTLDFKNRLDDAVEAGKVAKVEELMPWASRELQVQIDKTTQKLNDIEEARSRLVKNMREKGMTKAERQGVIDTMYGEEQRLKVKALRLELEDLKETQAGLGDQLQNKLDTALVDEHTKAVAKVVDEYEKWTRVAVHLYDEGEISLKKLNSYLDKIAAGQKAGLDDLKEKNKDTSKDIEHAWDDISMPDLSVSFSDDALSGINNLIGGVSSLGDTWEATAENIKAYDKAQKELPENSEAMQEAEEKYQKVAYQGIQNQLAGYSNLFGTMSQFFDEGSKERERLHQLEMAFGAAEIAMESKKMLMKAVTSIANAGTGDPYTAFARVAAMTALMGGVLSMAGQSLGGGGGSGSAPEGAETSGTVLGSPDESSESVSNSFDILEEYNDLQYNELQGIHDEVEDLNQNLTGIANAIVRDVGSFGENTFSGLDLGDQDDFGNKIGKFVAGGYVTDIVNQDFADLYEGTGMLGEFFSMPQKIFGGAANLIGEWGSELGGELFGEVERSLVQAGIETGGRSVRGLSRGASPRTRQYGLVKEEDDGGWFSSGSTDYFYQYQRASQDTQRLFGRLYQNAADTLMQFGNAFQTPVDAVKDYTFEIQKIDLKGLSGEEVQEEISSWWSTQMDKAVEDLFGQEIGKYQKIDEGLMETATRLMTTLEVVNSIAERTGQSTESADESAIEFSQSIVKAGGGLEKFAESAENYYEDFISEQQKLIDTAENYKQTFSDLDGVMKEINLVVPEGIDIPEGANKVRRDIPTTTEDFNNLIESLDLTTQAGKEAYTSLMDMAPALTNLFDFTDEFGNRVDEALNPMTEWEKRQQTINDAYDDAQSIADALGESVSKANVELAKQNELERARFETVGQPIASITADVQEAIGETVSPLLSLRDQGIREPKSLPFDFDIFEGGITQEELTGTLGTLSDELDAGNISGKQFETVMGELISRFKEGTGAVESLSDARSAYQEALQSTFDDLKEDFNEADDTLRDVISREQELVDARKDAAQSLTDLKNSLMGGDMAPVQSKEWFENRYGNLLGDVRSAETPSEISEATGDFSSFSKKYLDFMGDYGGDYKDVFGDVMSDIGSLKETVSPAEEQVNQLKTIKDYINDSKTANISLDRAFKEYKNAEERLDEASWMENELNRLQDIADNTKDLDQAIKDLQSVGGNIGGVSDDFNSYASGGYHSGGLAMVGEVGPELVNMGAGQVHSNDDTKKILVEAVREALGGTEDQNIQVIVKVGERELEDITTETIRTNPEAQHQVRRVAYAS